MSTRKMLIIALILCIALSSATIYSLAQQSPDPNGEVDDEIVQIALDFLVNGPTFSFDGVTESIKILKTYTLESYPVQHVVVISFETTHAGWGDREGTFVAQVITPHVIKITIVEGRVVEAVIDEKWDEIKQEIIIPEELLLPERARDLAMQYIIENYPELGELLVPRSWMSEMCSPHGLVGTSTIRYSSGGWSVTVKYPVVQYPDFSLEIEYEGETCFSWTGTVYHSGQVSTNAIEFN